MSRGRQHDISVKAEALRRYVEGEAPTAIARHLDIPVETLRSWIKRNDPARFTDYDEPSAQELGRRVYSVVLHTLDALEARAIVTSQPAWIERQEAGGLAQLDATTWDRLLRVISSFRPAETQHELGDAVEPTGDDGPDLDRNGAVDSSD